MYKACTRCANEVFVNEDTDGTGNERFNEACEKLFGYKNSATGLFHSHCKPCRRRKKSSRPVVKPVIPEKLLTVDFVDTQQKWRKEYPGDNQRRTWQRMAVRLVERKGYTLTREAFDKLQGRGQSYKGQKI